MSIGFSYPWLLLLLIPAVVLTLLPYFRLNKKYRKTRNRIISMSLHAVVMLLAILVLSGAVVRYNEPYLRNEILILVDASSSTKSVEAQKDDFVRQAIIDAKDEYKVGIILFGYGEPVVAARLSNDTTNHYRDYMNSTVPDESATDISGALRFAKEVFSDPQSGKIVLVTDGLETDGNALTTIMSLTAEGIKVDVAVFSEKYSGNDMQINDIILPQYAMMDGDEIEVGVVIRSSFSGQAKLTFFDNDTLGGEIDFNAVVGEQILTIPHVIEGNNLHEFRFHLQSNRDNIENNNVFYRYLFLEKFDKILILERIPNESLKFDEIASISYDTTVKLIADAPLTVEELRAYDQVVLLNIANADMPLGFIDALHSYVHEYGGGMLTIGGNKIQDGLITQNTYLPDDMYDPLTKRETTYQKMLPVESINYTPPLGLMIVMDRSGSMDRKAEAGGTQTLMDLAKQGAVDVINILSERDHVGIVTFSTTPIEEIKITPVTQKQKIINALTGIKPGGDTVYSGAIEKASRALQELKEVERRHIIFVTDGKPLESEDKFNTIIANYYDQVGITLSVVSIGADAAGSAICKKMAEIGRGRHHDIQANSVSLIPYYMQSDVRVDEIISYNPEPFQPKIRTHSPIVYDIDPLEVPELGGFYGTKKRDAALGVVEVLGADYAPVYASWKYGGGSVGSFMSDLSGDNWSNIFMNDDIGKKLILNIIKSLFPMSSMRAEEIQVEFREDNYSTHASIITSLEEGQYLSVDVINTSTGERPYETLNPVYSGGFARCSLVLREPGVYRIDVVKMAADGTEIEGSLHTAYKAFSYSKEYDMFRDIDEGVVLAGNLAEAGRGMLIELPVDIYGELQFEVNKEFDTRIVLTIIAIVLLLLDIAVRKFKFKWIHEIIRDYKTKKQLKLNVKTN